MQKKFNGLNCFLLIGNSNFQVVIIMIHVISVL